MDASRPPGALSRHSHLDCRELLPGFISEEATASCPRLSGQRPQRKVPAFGDISRNPPQTSEAATAALGLQTVQLGPRGCEDSARERQRGAQSQASRGCLMSRRIDAGPSASSLPDSVFRSLTEAASSFPRPLQSVAFVPSEICGPYS
ncbi:unnamed protein product [Rangifer tarandus platyrhynchus]|uniref:Uncharacterized protein n=1 Tax=Rangifer tarandus platyrhynchus TaxID=3082113 RepID=A0AC59ZHC6_RANTA